MWLKAFLSLCFAEYIAFKNKRWENHAIKAQRKVLKSLIKKARNTQFGVEHDFSSIATYNDWKKMFLFVIMKD